MYTIVYVVTNLAFTFTISLYTPTLAITSTVEHYFYLHVIVKSYVFDAKYLALYD